MNCWSLQHEANPVNIHHVVPFYYKVKSQNQSLILAISTFVHKVSWIPN